MSLAIIPARGGSKRIPRKNVKEFSGRPMIAYAIAAARASGLFEHVVVSTDDDEIAAIAREWGAETPFVRPADLATDLATVVPVITHGVEACRALGWRFEHVCCVFPAVPFVQGHDLQEAFELLLRVGSDYCFAVTSFPSAVQRALRRLGDGGMEPLYPQFEMTRTQDLEPAFHDAGQFYWGTADAWLRNSRPHSGGLGYVVPHWRAIDIDTPDDWVRAEVLFRSMTDLQALKQPPAP